MPSIKQLLSLTYAEAGGAVRHGGAAAEAATTSATGAAGP